MTASSDQAPLYEPKSERDESRAEKLEAIEQLLSSALVLMDQVQLESWVVSDVADVLEAIRRLSAPVHREEGKGT